MLEAARWAPNHHLTQPWYFTVVQGESKKIIARLRGEITYQKTKSKSPDEALAEQRRIVAEEEIHQPPLLIIVSMNQYPDPKRNQEDYAAVSAGIQNMMLVAWEKGIGMYWGTGPVITHPEIFTITGLPATQKIVGLFRVGYPAEVPTVKRNDLEKHLQWLD